MASQSSFSWFSKTGSVNFPFYQVIHKEGWWLNAGLFGGSGTSMRWEILTDSFLLTRGWLNIVQKLSPFLHSAIYNHSTRWYHHNSSNSTQGHSTEIITSQWKPEGWVVNIIILHHQEPTSLQSSEKRVNAKALPVKDNLGWQPEK